MANDTEEETTMRHDMHLRWLRLKRHLRSVDTSARALRDAARATGSVRSSLCRPSPARLAA